MALTVAASVTRTSLGLPSLNINDHLDFALGAEIMGGAVTWERNVAQSPWVDGEYTVSRRRPNIEENVQINVYGSSHADMLSNLRTVIDAFSQDTFDLSITMNGALYKYRCETANYTVEWGIKMHSHQCMITFQVPRQPIALAGV